MQGSLSPIECERLNAFDDNWTEEMPNLYGLSDRQFRRLFKIAQSRKGPLTLNLFIVLESRLDNMIFRMGFAPTRRSARQIVNHGHV